MYPEIIVYHKKGNFHTMIWRHCNKRWIETTYFVIFCISLTIKPSTIFKMHRNFSDFPCNFTSKEQISGTVFTKSGHFN
jgi:hypothetical protein